MKKEKLNLVLRSNNYSFQVYSNMDYTRKLKSQL